ncbi:hypothetical protein DPEC_G00062240 [Dallia pectoralis]|uniref:Uncharacterized protein n=1 Tax=Dallia pectoralis TaxID=75939 RepID=A0ACC2H7E4_DALPE|nr:hypothetical protein DPEC_G00062240 [Dallia pectoralis]
MVVHRVKPIVSTSSCDFDTELHENGPLPYSREKKHISDEPDAAAPEAENNINPELASFLPAPTETRDDTEESNEQVGELLETCPGNSPRRPVLKKYPLQTSGMQKRAGLSS